jgi:arsenate reductase
MTYTLIHFPKCSNSRKGLELLKANGIEPELRLYMKDENRLSEDELRDIAAKMDDGPRAFLREKNGREVGITETSTDDEIFAEMARNPKIIQRPIGINGDKAVMGRPQEKLLEII